MTTTAQLDANAPIVRRIREIRDSTETRFTAAQTKLSEHALAGLELTNSVIDNYADSFARYRVFAQALGMLDEYGIVDLDRVRSWNLSVVTMFVPSGSRVLEQTRDSEHEAHLALMRILNGERV